MYSGGMTAKMEADKRSEEAMLGQAPIQDQEQDKEVSGRSVADTTNVPLLDLKCELLCRWLWLLH